MKKNHKRIYLDSASTTPIDEEVVKVINYHLVNTFGNASLSTFEGRKAKYVLEESRTNLSEIFEASPDEIIFTSGGTESNNLAFWGVIRAMEKQGLALSKMHIVVSEIEHSSILSSAQAAKDIGISVSYARVDKNGIIMMKELEKIINPQTIFVSVMKANNEIGAIQPIKEISKLLRHKSKNNFFRHRQILDQLFGVPWPVLHSDWSQALLYIPFQARHYNGVSLVSFDSQKIYGPKGVGALFVRRRTHLVPVMYGGKQESGLRPGTENVPLIAGFSEAVSLAEKRRNVDIKKISSLRDLLLRKILSMGGGVKVNGSLKDRLPNNLSIYIPNINADFIVTLLDEFGISISTKSACLPYESASHVLTALGLSQLEAQSVLRISLGRYNTKRDIEAFLRFLRKSIDLQNSVKFY